MNEEQDIVRITQQIFNSVKSDKSSVLSLLEYITSEFPISVRKLAKVKAIVLIKDLKDDEKKDIAAHLLSRLSYTPDTWEQRNIAEILSSYPDEDINKKMFSIMNMPHIDERVRKKTLSA